MTVNVGITFATSLALSSGAGALAAEVVKVTLLLGLLFVVASALRRAPAAARHLLWSAGLSALFVLPLISATIPWRMEVLPAALHSEPALMARTHDAAERSPWPEGATNAEVPPPSVMPRHIARESSARRHDRSASPEASPSTVSAPSPPPAADSPAPLRLLPSLWLAGVLLLLARLAAGVLYVRWLVRRGSPANAAPYSAELRGAAARLGVTRPVRLLESAQVAMPITCGLLHPVIVLPLCAREWTTERRRAVLLHELAHVRRRDVLTHLMARVACAVYWFHPLVWMAARRLRADSERACDDLVLHAGTHASEYAEHLLHIVRGVGRMRAPVVALPLAQLSEFEGRLIAILEPGAKRHALTPARALLITVAVTMLAVPLAAMGPSRPPTGDAAARATRPASAVARPDVERRGASEVRAATLKEPSLAPLTNSEGSLSDAVPAVDVILLDSADSEGSVVPAPFATAPPESSRAIPSLIATLHDPHPDVRQSVIESLGQLDDTRATVPLTTMLEDKVGAVRNAAARALGELQDPRAIEALSKALRDDPEAEVRRTAAWALGEIEDKRALPALTAALAKDRDATVRKTAAWALGEIEDAGAVDALGAALRDEQIEVRRTAVWALGEIEDARAVDFLVPVLRDADAALRKEAAWALGEIESPRAVDALGAAIKDSDAKVREQATWALGEIEDRRALSFLATALKDGEVGVRRKAAWAVGELDDLETAPPALIEALRDSDHQVKKYAAHALAEIGDTAAVPGLSALVRSDDGELRRGAVWALSEIGGVRALEVLVDMLKDDDPAIRKMAAEALGKRRD